MAEEGRFLLPVAPTPSVLQRGTWWAWRLRQGPKPAKNHDTPQRKVVMREKQQGLPERTWLAGVVATTWSL